MALPDQPSNALHKLRTIEVTLTSQQLLWLLEEFGEDVNPAEGLVRLVNRTMASQYRARLKKSHDGVTVVQLHPPKPASVAPVVAQLPELDLELVNPIGVLQEHCQKQRYPLPEYRFSPTAQGFQCDVTAMGQRVIAVGSSKQSAKQQAARQLLAQLQGVS